jgi:hypothetical protein
MHAHELLVCGRVAALCSRDELGLLEWPAHHRAFYTATRIEVPDAARLQDPFSTTLGVGRKAGATA